ncbi:MAG TPA: hypothetical protein PLV96_04015, partial [Methanoregulaceae archaeon]|nr:hypothetical protein [Methanoregulaceae archaeon]
SRGHIRCILTGSPCNASNMAATASLGEAVAAIFDALHGEPVKMPYGDPRQSTRKVVAHLKKVMI